MGGIEVFAIPNARKYTDVQSLLSTGKEVKKVFKENPSVKVESYNGLTINFCVQKNAKYIIRGIRSSADFEYEKTIAQLNKMMQPEVDTFLILSSPELSAISSTIVREIIIGKGDTSKFLPKEVEIKY